MRERERERYERDGERFERPRVFQEGERDFVLKDFY